MRVECDTGMGGVRVPTNKPLKLSESEYNLLRKSCKIFKGCKDSKGYGLKRVEGKLYKAHRWLWEAFNGVIPARKIICHRCDRPACVNLDHLFLGTHQDNCNDKISKGRQADTAGENNPFSRLKEFEVRFIRFAKGAMTQVRLSQLFNISQSNVSDIQRGNIWKNI